MSQAVTCPRKRGNSKPMALETIDSSAANDLVQQAFTAHQQGLTEEAEKGYLAALAADPNHPEALHFLGIFYHQSGDNWLAQDYINQSLQEQPNRPQFHYHLGLVLEALGRDLEALNAYEAALELEPRFAEALNNRCGLRRRLGRLDEAAADAKSALELQPDLAVARTHLAFILHARGDPAGALENLDQALGQDPGNAEIWSSKVEILLQMDRLEAAEKTIRQGLIQHPDSLRLHNQLGNCLRILGNTQEAIQCHEKALRIDPKDSTAYYSLAPFLAHYQVDLQIDGLEEWYRSPELSPADRPFLAFGLGDYYAAQRDYESAFQYWLEANQLVRRGKRILPVAMPNRDRAWGEAFTAEALDQCRDWGHESDVPIFVVGMPRSGTTLVEQILSAHPEVTGAGEAGDLMGLIQKEIQVQEGSLDTDRWDHFLDPEKAKRLGAFYVTQMARLVGSDSRVVNKSPGNYTYIGLIQAILPNAKVVCCQRDPLDSGLSIFSKHFAGVNFSYGLEDIGIAYQGFREAMDHWRQVADPNLLTEIRYEDLVADPEANVAALLEHCGLPWNEACLRFFENQGPVRTASSVQVRQPLYTGAVERWRRYGNRLLPLAQTVGQKERMEEPQAFSAFSRLGRKQLEAQRFKDAVESFRSALLYETDRGELHWLLGQALEGRKRYPEAYACYREAASEFGGRPEQGLTMAQVCRKAGWLPEARQRLESLEGTAPQDEEAMEWAELLLAEWRFEAAEDALVAVLGGHPGKEQEALAALLRLYLIREEWEVANPVLDALMARAPESAQVGRLAVLAFTLQGRTQEAQTTAAQLLAQYPADAEGYLVLARAYAQDEQFGDAEAACREALGVDPEFAEAAAFRGYALQRLGQPEEAGRVGRHALVLGAETAGVWYPLALTLVYQQDFGRGLQAAQRAAELEPWNRESRTLQVAILERLNRLEEAEEGLAPLRECLPKVEGVRFWAARLARRGGRPDVAQDWLPPEPVGYRHPGYWAELGQIHDQLGETDRAFAFFQKANQRQAEQPEFQRSPKDGYLRFLGTIDGAFSEKELESWGAPLPPSREGRVPVFLVGFPRSGTTLLHQILDSHPAVTVLEEEPTIAPLWRYLREDKGGIIEGVKGLNERDVAQMRALYREARDGFLGKTGMGPGSLIVDKMPLRTVEVGLLYRLFPEARFLFARRHPCDCILSAFMQLFAPNPAMANFHTLEDAAALFARVMELWERYRRLLAPGYHEVRYEDLVGDFDGVVAEILDFLGLDWDEGVRDYRSTVAARGAVSTASYAQVHQPLYQGAAGRWRAYSQYFEKLLPGLEPWIRDGGYES
ncbi:sulfotransferase [Thiohalorhabdus sp.]|uniref:sulfotransferase n=1 Tax=Thiohalorhabdus sp. TaxID=3094134 RepID=UPI002FC31702